MTLLQEKKKEIIDQFKLHEKDTGSPEVQIALLSERIQ
ncbi:MAG: 30S ribosomal protein S15, partial [Thermodesulfobacteriota bacterium]